MLRLAAFPALPSSSAKAVSMPSYPFWKVTPSGNPTILLRAEDVPPALRAATASAVMDAQHLGGEQVGYIRLEGTPRLDMMGGEFCLNATRAFAAVLDSLDLLTKDGSVRRGAVEVSGASGPVAVRVIREEGSLPIAEACLHFDALPAPEALPGGSRLVRVPGIVHLIQNGPAPFAPGDAALNDFCTAQRNDLGLEQEEAVGHLWLRPDDAANGSMGDSEEAGDSPANDGPASALRLDPVVWVRDTATLCFESACGSGTLACALAEHAASGRTLFSIRQPSGQPLSVRMERNGDGWDVWVGGPVRLTACGETDLSGLL